MNLFDKIVTAFIILALLTVVLSSDKTVKFVGSIANGIVSLTQTVVGKAQTNGQ